MSPSKEESRNIAEELVRRLFIEDLDGQLIGSIVVIAIGISTDDTDKVISWYDGSATEAIGMAAVVQRNLLDDLASDAL